MNSFVEDLARERVSQHLQEARLRSRAKVARSRRQARRSERDAARLRSAVRDL